MTLKQAKRGLDRTQFSIVRQTVCLTPTPKRQRRLILPKPAAHTQFSGGMVWVNDTGRRIWRTDGRSCLAEGAWS